MFLISCEVRNCHVCVSDGLDLEDNKVESEVSMSNRSVSNGPYLEYFVLVKTERNVE